MKKLFLFTSYLVLSGSLLAQQGTFTISRDNAGNILVSNTADLQKKYSELVLLFEGIPGTSKIDFVTPDRNASLYGVGKEKSLNTISTNSGNNQFTIRIVQNQGNYVLNTDTSSSVMTNFLIEVDGKTSTAPFQLLPMVITPPVTPNLPNPSTKVALSAEGKSYNPGYLLYDALYLKENLEKDSVIREILKFYGIGSSTDLAYNQYLKNIMPDVFESTHSGNKIGDMASSVFSSVGNLDVTNFADDLAKFIVDRTKQELNIAFFDKFKEVLNDPKYVDLKTVFPETYAVLMVIDNQIYNYNDYLQALRNAFDRDLSDLPNNLPSIIDNHSAYFDANPGLKVILQSSFYIAQQVQLKEHPGQMIANYPVDEFMGAQTGINQNIAASFKTLQLVSKSFKSKTDSLHYWANDSLIKKLFTNDTAVKIYIGLLVQQAKKEDIVFKGKTSKELWKIIDSSYTLARGYEEYKNFFRTVSSKVRDIEKAIDALKEINKDSLKVEKYHVIAGKALDLMDQLIAVEKMPFFPKDLDIAKNAGIYIYSARTASDIVVDVNRKQYASAIMKTVMLYDTIFHRDAVDTFIEKEYKVMHREKAASMTKLKSELEEEHKKLSAQTGKNKPTVDQEKSLAKISARIKDVSKLLKQIEKDSIDKGLLKKWGDSIRNELSMTLKSLLKYGTFMSAIIDAKTSDDVEAAIESAALPVGSARIKRESTFNIALNAYCGPYMGYERVYDLDPKWMSASKSTINSYGLTAPVGISVSYGGNCRRAKNHSSYSLFLSVIDIGAIASFRFSDTLTEVLPTIQLKNILSPGIFFSYGIPKSPISVNAGWQMGPLLRKVDAQINENTYSDRYGRVSLSICIDIPIVNFYTFTSSGKPKSRH
ncbi:hypothetical protein [uncultured Fluviicola sp.]|uniref:hypothetical protein n=1 Tax=uncultured Fluviicola sp. TaxID=463303 RepID=UPI0025D09970|nr:hypothetical protein [uncultured Fluviicola sp.]